MIFNIQDKIFTLIDWLLGFFYARAFRYKLTLKLQRASLSFEKNLSL